MRPEALVGGLTLALALGVVALAPRPVVDNSAMALLAPGDARSAHYESLLNTFGGQSMLLIEQRGPNPSATAKAVQALHDAAIDREDVLNVVSLAAVHPDLTATLSDPDAIDLVEADVVGRDLRSPWSRSLRLFECSDDSKDVLRCAPVARSYLLLPAAAPHERAALRDMLATLALPSGVSQRAVGLPLLDLALHEASQDVEKTALPLLVGVIILVLLVLLRRPVVVGATMAVVGLGVFTSEALLGVAGAQRNLVVDVAKPVLLVLLLASSVHVIIAYRRHLEAGAARAVAAWAGAADTRRAVALALCTTALGFGSLAVADVPPIRAFGLSVATGLLLGVLLVTFTLPWVLSLVRPTVGRSGFASTLSKWVKPERVPAVMVTAAVLVCAAGGFAFSQLRVEPHAIKYFPADQPLRQDWEAVEASGVGLTSLDLVVTATSAWLDDGKRLAALDAGLQTLVEQHGVRAALGLPLVLREAHYRRTSQDKLPGTNPRQQLAGIDADLEPFVSDDGLSLRVALLLPTLDAAELNALRSSAAEAWKQVDFEFHFTGVYDLLLQAQDSLLKTLSRSLGITALIMTLFLMFAFRSVALGVTALLPNLAPVALVFIVMALCGWSLDVGTCMVAAVALGIAVDDTMHFGLEWIRHGPEAATQRTGTALLASTIVIAAGFLALAFTSFAPTQRFGVLTATAVVGALIADLTVWPAILLRFVPKK